ncbi:AMP-binding protein [Streptomyces sp. NPDC058728]
MATHDRRPLPLTPPQNGVWFAQQLDPSRLDCTTGEYLGVLRSGGRCVPVDPGYPADRIAYVISDSGARVLVVAGCLRRARRPRGGRRRGPRRAPRAGAAGRTGPVGRRVGCRGSADVGAGALCLAVTLSPLDFPVWCELDVGAPPAPRKPPPPSNRTPTCRPSPHRARPEGHVRRDPASGAATRRGTGRNGR